MVEQLLEGLTGAGCLLALDNAFLAISLLQTVWEDWNTGVTATQPGNSKHPKGPCKYSHIFWVFTIDCLTIFEQDSYKLIKHYYSFELKVLICFFLFLFFILIYSFFLTQLKFVKFVSLTKAFLCNNKVSRIGPN